MELSCKQQGKKSTAKRRLAVVVLILASSFVCVIAINYYKLIRERLNVSICNSNLKQLANGLHVYQLDLKDGENESSRHFPSFQELVEYGVLDNDTLRELEYCPKTHTKYIYVQYERAVNPDSAAARNTPVLFDSVIGCHKHRNANFFGVGTENSWTLIAFEAGQVSVVENLICFKDIYDKYAPFMSKDDAVVLRKCCEAADNK
ncbi:MAG: hypothetical protein IKX30_05445 [Victivallales bacterium]|nr:hypothetical protein [Victivallales bacterium]